MKALLLAAGYGTRLKPLTDHIPKPLTLFMGRPILDLAYLKVSAAGVEQVAVNTHHLPQSIELHIQSSALYKRPIHMSFEPEILGTGGSINPLRPWLAGDDLLIFNGDVLTSLDLEAFIKAYKASAAIAAMVLIPHKAGTTPVYLKGNRVVAIGEAPPPGALKRTFAGVHILGQGFVEAVPRQGFFSVIETYKALLAEQLVLAFDHNGFWADLGIPRDYFEAHQGLWQHPQREAVAKSLQLDMGTWTYDVRQQSLFVDCQPSQGFHNSFVFGPLQGDPSIHIDHCIVYPNTSLTKHRQESRKIITPYASLGID